jgi:hypothetical protein
MVSAGCVFCVQLVAQRFVVMIVDKPQAITHFECLQLCKFYQPQYRQLSVSTHISFLYSFHILSSAHNGVEFCSYLKYKPTNGV